MIKVSVIGAGTMGSGIAQIAATKGHEVCLYDYSNDSLDKSKNKLKKILNRLVEKEKINNEKKEQIISRIKFSSNLKDIQGSSLVIEAIIEFINPKLKTRKLGILSFGGFTSKTLAILENISP